MRRVAANPQTVPAPRPQQCSIRRRIQTGMAGPWMAVKRTCPACVIDDKLVGPVVKVGKDLWVVT